MAEKKWKQVKESTIPGEKKNPQTESSDYNFKRKKGIKEVR